jgi:hypothetical protein
MQSWIKWWIQYLSTMTLTEMGLCKPNKYTGFLMMRMLVQGRSLAITLRQMSLWKILITTRMEQLIKSSLKIFLKRNWAMADIILYFICYPNLSSFVFSHLLSVTKINLNLTFKITQTFWYCWKSAEIEIQ